MSLVRWAMSWTAVAVMVMGGVAAAKPPSAAPPSGNIERPAPSVLPSPPGHTAPHRDTHVPPVPMRQCSSSAIQADVVAIDHPMVFNRLGAQNVNWMLYALRHDLIDLKTQRPLDYTTSGNILFQDVATRSGSRGIALRPDLRPRPLVLRVAEGAYLKVRFTNLLEVRPVPPHSTPGNPFNSEPDPLPNIDHPVEHAAKDAAGTPDEKRMYKIDDQVASRMAGFHPQGLELVGSIGSDSSFVGKNARSLAVPGETREYCFYAPKEGAYLVSNDGVVFGGEGTAGDSGVGLFAAVTVQPKRARFYRAQLTEEELRLATMGKTPGGQPIINYEAVYPNDCAVAGVWCKEGKTGRPILNMVQHRRLMHGDINAIIVGPNRDGSFDCSTYPLEGQNKKDCARLIRTKQKPDKTIRRNPALPNRLEPFREFVSIFHDENAATQALPYFFEHPELSHTLHGVRDGFMINYGSGGIGAEILANRLKAGPMQDCLDCAYEEFFLSSFAVGDAAMLVDKPANLVISQCQPEYIQTVKDPNDPSGAQEMLDPAYAAEREKYCVQPKDQRATEAYYPHDPANVHHSYIGDFVKFRNLHSGKEQHIFHLHNHQWLFNPNDDNSNYIDAQGVGPGSGYTYEIAYGGSGNRNKTVGDAIFHCHFYPHFAQGMWYLWRVHDVFEAGTRLAVSENKTRYHQNPFGLMHGKPAPKARALPDGEIEAGTPIPAIVPLPGKGMAIVPAQVMVTPRQGLNGDMNGSVAKVLDRKRNPGYPFWVAGAETTMGSRPTTPPLDMSEIPGVVAGHDGGLPRHALAGYSSGGTTKEKFDRMTAEKHIEQAMPVYYPETGTDLEQVAMAFHALRTHPTHQIDMAGVVTPSTFITNGAPPIPGAPYNEPCIDDDGHRLTTNGNGHFFGGAYGSYVNVTSVLPGGIQFSADAPRVYRGANVQLDVVFNKVGYHYGQQRLLALWEDVGPLLDNTRPPEPLVLRLNTFDCAMYAHTNLVPHYFYADDYQITTPTDVIGQHIHLPKWDLTAADGSANGWNYEDGTFSPGMVRERITAINAWNVAHAGQAVPNPYDGTTAALVPKVHPYFNGTVLPHHQRIDCEKLWKRLGGEAHAFEKKYGIPGSCDWFGARTTLQRWFSDPLINQQGIHRGLGITFTHDHLGPSTHQQLGLYATMLTEPPGSEWRQNETGALLYDVTVRNDGGPTSWQAIITGNKQTTIDVDGDRRDDSHREFFLQFGDFQHAYQKGAYYGVNKDGVPSTIDPSAAPTKDSFRQAINPSVRKPANPVYPESLAFEQDCPGGTAGLPGAVYNSSTPPLRPCPESISADDVGMMVVNYRNEPIGARVYDPKKLAADGQHGDQASGFAGDLVFATQTRTDRKIPELNTVLGATPYPALTFGLLKGDPFTPLLRAYAGDLVRVKIQAGSHEHEHNGSINALAWTQGGSGFGQAPHSGWRNAQNAGLSEQFTFSARITDYETSSHLNDRLYTIDGGQDGMWNGVWGILRSLNRRDSTADHLIPLPSQPRPTVLAPEQGQGFDNGCPIDSRVRRYEIAAVLANRALDNALGVTIPPAAAGSTLDPKGGTLIYNPRATTITLEMEMEEEPGDTEKKKKKVVYYGSGPLHDPTAILFVRNEDLDGQGRIKPGRPVEPLVLRAAAGDCVQVVLHNRLPKLRGQMADLDGDTSMSGIIRRNAGSPGSKMTSFNNNLIRPSNRIGLHPQLVHYDVQAFDGNNVGVNKISTIAPGWTKVYQWYAGVVEIAPSAEVCPEYKKPDAAHKYEQLSAFARQPQLRPLTELLTKEAFQEVIEDVLTAADRTSATGAIDTAAQTRVSETPAPPVAGSDSRATGLDKAVNRQLFAQLSQVAERAQCLESVPVGRSVTQMSAVAGQEFDEAPLLDASAYYDRGKVLNRRLSCAEKLIEPFTEVLRTYSGEKEGKLAALIARSFVFEVEGIEVGSFGRNEYAWREMTYPPLTAETTRLAELSRPPSVKEGCRYAAVEFGGTNLTPPDRIKQGQKAAVGALVIEPKHARWREYFDDTAIDRQDPGVNQTHTRATRATATVTYPVTEPNGILRLRSFRDLVLLHQKGLNLRYAHVDDKKANGKGTAVANLAAEKEEANEAMQQTAPEDAHDSGHMAINYGTEPMWFRFGLPPDAPFGKEGFGGAHYAWQAFRNLCCQNGGTVMSADANVGEPYVPIVRVPAGSEMRIRALLPTGTGRATTVELHGHNWPRDPYLAERVDSASFPLGGRPAQWGIPSQCIGANPMAIGMGGQESITPLAHFDMVFSRAGGTRGVPGDYLWRDHGGFGITSGLWALVRVEPTHGQFAPPTGRATCR